MKLSISTDNIGTAPAGGILYLLEFSIEGKKLVKIGLTTRPKVEDRICEILTAMWKKYRIFPECYPKRFKTTENVYEKEQKLHQQFREQRFEMLHKFPGSTEFFDVPLEQVVEAYDAIIG